MHAAAAAELQVMQWLPADWHATHLTMPLLLIVWMGALLLCYVSILLLLLLLECKTAQGSPFELYLIRWLAHSTKFVAASATAAAVATTSVATPTLAAAAVAGSVVLVVI
jgi:hypothetical protein